MECRVCGSPEWVLCFPGSIEPPVAPVCWCKACWPAAPVVDTGKVRLGGFAPALPVAAAS